MNQDILKKLYRYCSSAEKCKSDIKNYLYKFNLEDDEIGELIENLENNNFINEERYVSAFVNDKLKFNKWGKIKINYELKSKGIDEKTIIKAINSIDEDEYLEILFSVLKTKLALLSGKNKVEQRLSLLTFGMSRGFEFENIEKVYKSFCNI